MVPQLWIQFLGVFWIDTTIPPVFLRIEIFAIGFFLSMFQKELRVGLVGVIVCHSNIPLGRGLSNLLFFLKYE